MGAETPGWGKGDPAGRDSGRSGGRMKTYLAAFSAPTLVYVLFVERIYRSVLLEMAGKELLPSLVNDAGHGCRE